MTAKKTDEAPAAAEGKAHYAVRKFKDAGSKRSFAKGAKLENLTEGELANYVEAGLATTEQPKADEAA